jgi:hypothetical protein
MSTLKAHDVENEIRRQWVEAHSRRASHVDIRAGDVHRKLGGQNRVPQVCQVMMRLRGPQDIVIDGPPSGQGTNLTVRYLLPRESGERQELPILSESPLTDDEPPQAGEEGRRFDAHRATNPSTEVCGKGQSHFGTPLFSRGRARTVGRDTGVVGARAKRSRLRKRMAKSTACARRS